MRKFSSYLKKLLSKRNLSQMDKRTKQKYELALNVFIYGAYSIAFFVSLLRFLGIDMGNLGIKGLLIFNAAFSLVAALFMLARSIFRISYVREHYKKDACQPLDKKSYKFAIWAYSIECIGISILMFFNIALLIAHFFNRQYYLLKYIQSVAYILQISCTVILLCLCYQQNIKTQENVPKATNTNMSDKELMQYKRYMFCFYFISCIFSVGAFVGDTIFLLESDKFFVIENQINIIKEIAGDSPIVGISIKFCCLVAVVLFTYLGYRCDRRIDNEIEKRAPPTLLEEGQSYHTTPPTLSWQLGSLRVKEQCF